MATPSSDSLTDALAQVRAALLDDAGLVRAVASGRRRGNQPPWRRVELRYVDLKAGRRLQQTAYDERQAHTTNAKPGAEAAAAVDRLLDQPYGNWHVETTAETLQLRVTKRGGGQLHRGPSHRAAEPVRTHDRSKRRSLPPSDPMLHAVGISDRDGRIKPSMQAKYRQVEAFVRLLDAGLQAAERAGALPGSWDRPPRVADLGCGNAYLTFAAFAHLRGARGLPVRMWGIDANPAMVRRNTELAEGLGWGDDLTFVAGRIEDTELPVPPDVVLALHACDTATDDALARAVGWAAPVILAAPCCHHDLQAQLRSADTPAPYAAMMAEGILRERFADVLTDTLRASLLRRYGYRVDVVEFVDSKHTPRNTLLRAVRLPGRGVVADPGYDELVSTWGVRPALADRLGVP